jgi:hypothetical protein
VTRRSAHAALAAAILAVSLVASKSPRDLVSHLWSLPRYASQELAVRRLNGRSTDFDRRYFILLEWARPRVPKNTRGIAVFPDGELPSRGTYLTIYEFAPLPTLVAPDRVPDGWLALVYGRRRPAGWRVVDELPYGALLEPTP